jgi:hypothetical protein
MFVKEDGLLLFGGQQICGIAVCALCSVKFGSEEGIYRCAEHGPRMTASSMPVAPVASVISIGSRKVMPHISPMRDTEKIATAIHYGKLNCADELGVEPKLLIVITVIAINDFF